MSQHITQHMYGEQKVKVVEYIKDRSGLKGGGLNVNGEFYTNE